MKLFIILCFISLALFANTFNVTKVRGDVYIGAELAKVGDKANVGDTVKSIGKGSFVQFTSTTGSVFLLRNGILKLETNNPKTSYLNLIRGKLFHVLENSKTNLKVNIKTAQAVFGIRGTKYFIEVKDDKSYLCVCEGIVRAKDLRTLEYFDTKANEDLYLYSQKKAEKKSANKMMIMMGSDTFKEMGYPLN
jgi:hypothetical protein